MQKFLLNLMLIMSVCFSLVSCNHDKPTSQDARVYIPSNTGDVSLISAATQKELIQNYLQQYFSPWTDKNLEVSIDKLDAFEQQTLHHMSNHLGFGSNSQPYDKSWFQAIVQNINLSALQHIKAISVSTTDIRLLPTTDPLFLTKVSQKRSYPFDRLQTSALNANTPLLIVNTTRDGAWRLVITPFEAGWVPSHDIALVNQELITRWMHAAFITFLTEPVAIKDSAQQFRFYAKIGAIYPLVKNTQPSQILIAVADENQQAVIKTAQINPQQATAWPLMLTTNHIAQLANKLLGQSYGWGELYGYRDCSATTMNLFAPFALWLPRNSATQATAGQFTDLSQFTYAERKKIIEQKGKPFLTLLNQPGHVQLYIGNKDGEAYVLQTVWGDDLYSKPFPWKHHVFYGRTVITPFSEAKSMTIIGYPYKQSTLDAR